MTSKDARLIETQLEQAAQTCAHAGGQLTDLRRLVLRLIFEAEAPLTAYQLLDRLKAVRPGAVPPTIYRSLDFLLQHGLIHKVERLAAFIACRGVGHHDHPVQFLICRTCGTVAEIEDVTVEKALRQAARRAGFQPAAATVEVDGTCSNCAHAA